MPPINTPEQTEFFRTLAAGDEAAIRACVAKNLSLLESFDYRSFGATPLTGACFSNRPALVAVLLELGADPNRRSDWHMGPWSPLHCAVFRGDKQLARYLLSQGAVLDVHTAAGLGDVDALGKLLDANPERVHERGGDGCLPLHFADTAQVAMQLLDRGADIDARCVDHYSTPVQYLCSRRPEVARHLLSIGARPDIFSAATCGALSTIQQLLGAQPELMQARINQTWLPPGSEHNVYNIMTFSIGSDSTALHAAARGNQRESVLLLIENGMSPDIRGGYDSATPLHLAAWNNCPVAAQALLDGGADLEARSGKLHNNTPAGWSIVAGSDEVFALLLDRGAERHPWFLEDARDALDGRFDQVSQATREQRQRILKRVEAE